MKAQGIVLCLGRSRLDADKGGKNQRKPPPASAVLRVPLIKTISMPGYHIWGWQFLDSFTVVLSERSRMKWLQIGRRGDRGMDGNVPKLDFADGRTPLNLPTTIHCVQFRGEFYGREMIPHWILETKTKLTFCHSSCPAGWMCQPCSCSPALTLHGS